MPKNKFKTITWIIGLATVIFTTVSCYTAEEEFIGDRLLDICENAYPICNVPAGCTLDKDHYVEGLFPGVHRVVVNTEQKDTDVQVRLFFYDMRSSGTELLVQLYEEDCTINTIDGKAHMDNVDIFDEAGDDRTLIFTLNVKQKGEHLLEVYSDAATGYLLIAE